MAPEIRVTAPRPGHGFTRPARPGVIFFDVDDTLAVRATGSYVAILLDAIDTVLGIRPAVTVHGPDTYLDGQRVTGVTTGALSLHAATLAGLSPAQTTAAAARIAETTATAYAAACAAGTICLGSALPGAVDTVRALAHTGWALGAATGRIAASGYLTLRHLGLDDVVTVHARSDLAVDKAAAIRDLCASLRADGWPVYPHQCAVVGDAVADMAAAAELGALGIGVTTGSRTAQQLTDAGAGMTLPTLVDAAPAIGAALGAHQQSI